MDWAHWQSIRTNASGGGENDATDGSQGRTEGKGEKGHTLGADAHQSRCCSIDSTSPQGFAQEGPLEEKVEADKNQGSDSHNPQLFAGEGGSKDIEGRAFGKSREAVGVGTFGSRSPGASQGLHQANSQPLGHKDHDDHQENAVNDNLMLATCPVQKGVQPGA
jgi:hypothetical protein